MAKAKLTRAPSDEGLPWFIIEGTYGLVRLCPRMVVAFEPYGRTATDQATGSIQMTAASGQIFIIQGLSMDQVRIAIETWYLL